MSTGNTLKRSLKFSLKLTFIKKKQTKLSLEFRMSDWKLSQRYFDVSS